MLGKFKFLQILLDYEHYIPLNLPLPPVLTSLDASQLIRDFWYANCTPSFSSPPLPLPLSAKPYRHKHFLAGLLLRELDLESAQEKSKAMRTQAVITLRNLLKKHDTDERYVMVGAKQRIADLYFPYLLLVSGSSHMMTLTFFQCTQLMDRMDRLLVEKEKVEWLLCFVYIIKSCSRDLLRSWWRKDTQKRQIHFLSLLATCLQTLEVLYIFLHLMAQADRVIE